MSETTQASLTTDPLEMGVQREYRQLMKLTLEALDTELQPASQGLAALHEVTVKLHTRRILEKLGVRNRAAAAAMAVSRGLISDDPAK